MITTTLAVLALAGALNTGASPSPGWQMDYAHAMSIASAERKPMAVFIGHGATTPARMIADGTISSDAARLLKDSYVSVFLDTETKAGKQLASQLDLSEGLVISSPGGSHQALRHNGNVSGKALTQELTTYATAGQPQTTVSTGAVVAGPVVAAPTAPVYLTGGCASGNCPLSSQPAVRYAYPNGTPYYGSANPFGGSCPNGNCPLQR
jgi:hypothetical protein